MSNDSQSHSIPLLLRLQVQGDQQMKCCALTITDTASQFTSRITSGFRKRLYVYNNSSADSGELYFGGSDVTGDTGMPIKKGLAPQRIPIASGENTAIYFVAESGQKGDLRVLEIS